MKGKIKGAKPIDMAVLERLIILNEECSEVQQIISKIIRHGMISWHPDDDNKTSNKELLEREVGDLMFALIFMIKNNDIDAHKILSNTEDKHRRIGKYLHYNKPIEDVMHFLNNQL